MKVSFYLTRPKADTETCIFARLCFSGYKLKFYTKESIHPKFWNSKQQRAIETSRFREYPEFNVRLKNIETDIKNLYRKFVNDNAGVMPSPDEFKSIIDKELNKKSAAKESGKNFFSFFDTLINKSESGVRLHHRTGKPISKNTIKTYKTTLRHLKEFQKQNKRKIDFSSIDFDFYSDYKEYLMKGERFNDETKNFEPLDMATNTIGKHIQIIKLVLNEATECGLNTNLNYKSKRFVTIREKTDNIYLTENEIEQLSILQLNNKRLEKVRDLFLIGCFTGLRYSDYSILKPEQIKNGFIETTQIKTGDPVVIPVHSAVQKIIEKYKGMLPKSISNQRTNEYLKEIAKDVKCFKGTVLKAFTKGGLAITKNFEKWELLTTHTARRSFATNEYLAGTPTITIMAITGHKTEKAFLRYIKLTPNEHAKLLKMHWEKRNLLRRV